MPMSMSQQRFGEHAQKYVTSQDHAQGTDLDRLIAIAQPQPNWRVLDVATGGGHTALKFAPYVARVIASDITPQMLQAAEGHITAQGVGSVTFKPVDAQAMPFDDAVFNLVTCRIAPHHFDDVAAFLREAARVVKPGGLVLVQDHVLPEDINAALYIEAFEKLRDPSHQRAFNEAEWRAMFSAAGLSITHVERVEKSHNFAAWVDRQGVTSRTQACLRLLLEQAPPAVAGWLRPRALGTSQATFVTYHIIIAGTRL